MKTNPVIRDVRKTRKQISLQYGNDLKILVDYYQKMEKNIDCKLHECKVLRKVS